MNKKYADAKSDTFFLLHRPRRWNARENLWMGYERKRGKIADLNSFLLGRTYGSAGDRFSLIVGHTDILSNVKYVITLDTGTQLPRGSAWQFVGAMAHPLNHARYKADKERVLGGYCILQPRVAISLSGTNRSRYARLFESEPGIDPFGETTPLSNAAVERRIACVAILRNMAGTVSGTGAPISTMARRWDRQTIPSAGSTRLRKTGPPYQAQEIMSVLVRPWKPWMRVLFAASMGWYSFWTHLSTNRP